jgi:thiol-disulfide isomerase/thioredoxin
MVMHPANQRPETNISYSEGKTMSRHLSPTRLLAVVALFLFTLPALAVVNVGDKPELQFNSANGAGQVSLEKYKGKIIVVDFWATWCGPCMAEADHMVKVNADYAPKGLQFIGISLDTDVQPLLKVAKEKGFTWPQKFDQTAPVAGNWGVTGIPSTFIIGPDGVVLWKGHPSQIDRALADAFKNHPPQLVDPKVLADATATADKIEAALKNGGEASALKQLATIPAAAKADKDFAARIATIEKQVSEYATKSLSEIDPLIEKKQYVEAASKLSDLTKALGALPAGAEAKKKLADLMTNPEAKAQFELVQKNKAGEEELAIAKRLQADGKSEQAYLKYKTIATSFAGTAAGNQAKTEVANYEKDPALVKQANDSVVAAKAKGMMGMAKNYARAGRADMAKKKYEEVIKAFPGSEPAKEAKSAIDEINRNAPK